MAPGGLQTHHLSSSEKGLSSVSTLIIGSKFCILIDPPFLVPDANAVVSWVKKTTSLPLKAVFVTHHHPDHYFSANPVLDAFPGSQLFAAPYVCAGIDREYDEKVKYWPSVFGKENVPEKPTKPTPFEHSLIVLEGNETSPVILLGPLQGDSVDHTLFWLPTEQTIVCGDSVYARSTHAWVEEVETPQLLHAWHRTLDLIEALKPVKVIPGHIEQGWALDAKEDLAYMRKYLDLFAEKITNAKKKPTVDELYKTFKDAFPQADKNLDFFLGHLSNQFGEGGQVWEENRHHNVGARTKEQLEAYYFTA
ncbi:hypothetical protein BAUCODRAFT_28764 [Baudoinia panamericana UAMH 10762]|uniref:Metallo-beta-lactamase domain-containing protein n=1 Tax=Baudoinia panamericana (strain UAMH 10762) TaxID=717646 RepID=M2MU10_BAUPA|nr:uncharacterized protein BAUCODRAFT_28764 [Baudoinia panamericana UAMH 10762]EMD00412.1 hypothetical protein BAUCODRAFT_28764 [Baudoinia panamericana UAMH 10762]